jgi:serine/threonine protein kinase
MPIPLASQQQMLGPYRLLRILGEGGMGTVYLAMDEPLNRQVALKVLRADKPTQAQASIAKRFIREAQSAAKLNHPNVVTIYAVGQHAGGPYIAMEYVDGGSLAERLRQSGPLYWRDAARVLCDALRALAAAHRAGIVHRDIKPANLMLARGIDGEELVKLTDFGLARINTVHDADLTFPGAFVGSPSYSAPEQIAGSHKIDGRADLYSLAATAYALLTGQPPFVAEDPAEVMERHLQEPFPDVRLLAPTVPAEFQALIAQGGGKTPADRFQSATAMLKAVEALLRLPGEPARPATMPRNRQSAKTTASTSDSIAELETRLALARKQSDASTQLTTLCALYDLYGQSRRTEDARRAFREALVLHVKLQAPGANN